MWNFEKNWVRQPTGLRRGPREIERAMGGQVAEPHFGINWVRQPFPSGNFAGWVRFGLQNPADYQGLIKQGSATLLTAISVEQVGKRVAEPLRLSGCSGIGFSNSLTTISAESLHNEGCRTLPSIRGQFHRVLQPYLQEYLQEKWEIGLLNPSDYQDAVE